MKTAKFILDVHLGALAKYLRMLGFDSAFETNYQDDEIIAISKKQKRIILSRDKALLKDKKVTHGYYVESIKPTEQVIEVIHRLDLFKQAKPFSRCLICNRKITTVKKDMIRRRLPTETEKYFNEFFQCRHCNKVFWKGSHYQRMKTFIDSVLVEKK